MSSFIQRNRAEWQELEVLVKKCRRVFGRVSAEDLARLDLLYRRATTHLSQVRTRTRDQHLSEYLNSLTAAAHSILYLPPRRGMFAGAGDFLLMGFSRAVARTWRYHAVAALLMLAGALLAFFAVLHNPEAAYAIMPDGEIRMPGATREQLLDVLRSGREDGEGLKLVFASFLFQHNLKVGILSLAGGVLAGVPTVLLTFYNGLMIGAFSAIHHSKGLRAEYWGWILPHGVSELWAIALCGGVGLLLGHALLKPGFKSRSASLQAAGAEAVRICLGCAIMLVVAAFSESFIRQSHLSDVARLCVAAGIAVFWTAYFAAGFIFERTMRGDTE